METDLKKLVLTQLLDLRRYLDTSELIAGEKIALSNACQLLSQSARGFEFLVSRGEGEEQVEYALTWFEEKLFPQCMGEGMNWDRWSFACLLEVENELRLLDPRSDMGHKKYSREGMIRRVMSERRQKADKANYFIRWADNIYGDHQLTNEFGRKYRIFLRDFDKETGYSDSMDARLNKLGTTKHIMFAFRKLKEDSKLFRSLDQRFPFIEVFCDPLNDYRITWFYPYELPRREGELIAKYFGDSKVLDEARQQEFLGFLNEAANRPLILVRPEVSEQIERAFEQDMLEQLKQSSQLDFSGIHADLFPYQKEGIAFAVFRKTAIIADEMGLGKTLQAIGTALLKKEIFGFRKTLVVTPASLKEQWKKEIERFTNEKAIVVEGFPNQREDLYRNGEAYFFIVNYETILRDQLPLKRSGFDFLILDEAQRIKNFETKTANAVSKLSFRHAMVITGTPVENKLIDLFSIVGALDPYFFGPLWEFSYQHCLFDPDKLNKINGYYDLHLLNKRLADILIRREKQQVLDQLPGLIEIEIPVNLSDLQSEYHAGFAKGIASILRKRFITPFDIQKIQLLLANMRMVCNSTFLIDGESFDSPKLDELRYMLLEKLDIKNNQRKVIIFSEWVKMHKLIGQLLRDNQIGFVELNGSVPVKHRGELIRKFEESPHCQIFLSTEAGGSGLNLQVADTLINIELPWNPAKKNQRIGRIDRLGQKSQTLSVFNFVSRNSIESRIAAGLIVKQNLFDGVLGAGEGPSAVDFSSKGRAQFIKDIEEMLGEFAGVEELEEEIAADSPVQAGLPTEPYPVDPSQEEISMESDSEPDPVKEPEEVVAGPAKPEIRTEPKAEVPKPADMEQVMNHGMQFLAGLLKMTTGQDLGLESKTVEINPETGEVTMRFKIPVPGK